jgi:general secretion pathway protein A
VQDEHSVAGVADGYEPFFGLAEAPFTLTSSPRFLFESESYRAALNEIVYSLSRREQIVVVTGPIGTGKTTLCRMINERRDPRAVVALISSPPKTADDLFRQILDGFDLLTEDTRRIVEASHFGLLKVFQHFLNSLAAVNAHAILIFDEAQHLPANVLEEIRLLLNLDPDRQLLQIVLVGQPELGDLLARSELGQMDQRVARRHQLEPLKADEVPAYVNRRLKVAQMEQRVDDLPTFTATAMHAIATLSHGVPRVVNIICDRSLENAWSDKTHVVDSPAVIRAAKSLTIEVPASLTTPPAAVPEVAPWSVAPQPLTTSSAAPIPYPETYAPTAPKGRARRPYVPIAVAAALAVAVLVVWMSRGRGVVSSGANPASSPEAGRQAVPSVPASRPAPPPAVPTAVVADVSPKVAADPPDAASTVNKFLIIVSSFRTRDRSVRVASDISALGLPAFVRSSSGWEQVIVGPYTTRQEAIAAQSKLESEHFEDTKVTQGGP